MEPSIPHILIAEREFLIALDAEYLIKSALECRITLLRPEQVDLWDAAALADVDLCLLDVPLGLAEIAPRIARLIAERVRAERIAVNAPSITAMLAGGRC